MSTKQSNISENEIQESPQKISPDSNESNPSDKPVDLKEEKPESNIPKILYAKPILPDSFEMENHFYQKTINAELSSVVTNFMNLGNERIAHRYAHLHPSVDPLKLKSLLAYKPRFFNWSGADLFNVTTSDGRRTMILIETNSCPSGQKSMPLMFDHDEYGSYRTLIENTFKPMMI